MNTMPTEKETDIAALNIRRGVCLQDFETTLQPAQDFETALQPDVDEIHLCGLLNMSVLWNKLSYIYDTAVGDNPHLIRSFLLGAEHKLYSNFEEYVEKGVVSCLVRDKITLPGRGVVHTLPNMSRIFASWLERDENRTDRFLTQIFGEQRDRYNRNIDRLLDGAGNPVKRYNQDKSKPVFRSLIRKSLSDGGEVAKELRRFPQEIQTAYQRICNEKEQFTTADVWEVIKDLQSARPLVVVQGYINQQALADSLGAGVSGADWGHRWRPDAWHVEASPVAEVPASIEELGEQADFRLKIPTLQLVGRLEPGDVLKLRENAPFEIKHEQHSSATDREKRVREEIEKYWKLICEKIEQRFFALAKEKRWLYGWVSDQPPYERFMKSPDHVKQGVEMVIHGVGDVVRVPERLKIWFLYEDTELMRKTRRIEARVWSPESHWSVQRDDSRRDASESQTKNGDSDQ